MGASKSNVEEEFSGEKIKTVVAAIFFLYIYFIIKLKDSVWNGGKRGERNW